MMTLMPDPPLDRRARKGGRPRTKEMTAKQREILLIVYRYTTVHRFAPSFREIGRLAQLQSSSTVSEHLKALRSRELVLWEYAQPRTLRVTDVGHRVLIDEIARYGTDEEREEIAEPSVRIRPVLVTVADEEEEDAEDAVAAEDAIDERPLTDTEEDGAGVGAAPDAAEGRRAPRRGPGRPRSRPPRARTGAGS